MERSRIDIVPWPADRIDEYVAHGYWRNRPLGSYLGEWADRYGSRVALTDGDRKISYRELAELADALAERLAGRGLRHGDRILVQLPNSWELVVLLFACLRLGVAPVLALMPHREHELAYLAELAEVAAIAVPDRWRDFDHQALVARVAARFEGRCAVLVAARAKASAGDTAPGPAASGLRSEATREGVALEALGPARAKASAGDTGDWDLRRMSTVDGDPVLRRAQLDQVAPAGDDVALFLLSGGTTGLPKIINRTHNDYEYNARGSGEVCGFTASTVYLAVLPVAHNFALGSPGVLGTLMVGGHVVLLPSPEPTAAFAAIERERVTITSVVPAVAHRWVSAVDHAAYDLSSLKVIQVGGSPLAPEEAEKIPRALRCQLQQVFGMAEGLLNYTRLDDPPDVVLTTQGRPICPHDEILIVDEDGLPVPDGEPGELLTRGPYTPRGYFRAPEHNARAFTDGWYRTGDIVRRHPSGNFVVEGRFKDLINRGGEKISAEEIESIVRTLPEVAEVAAVAAPDPEFGESVCVCVVPHSGRTVTLDQIRATFGELGVARFKVPQRLELLTRLPVTPVGKIDKKALRQRVAAVPPLAAETGTRGRGSAVSKQPPALDGVHHIAHVTWKPRETLEFYRDALGLPLVHTVSATGWLSENFPDFLHFFFDLGKGNHLAFFYYFGLPEDRVPDELMRVSRHLAFDVQTEEELLLWRDRLKSYGIPVTPPLTHELVESIYFDDPNGLQLEIARPLRPFVDIDARDAALTLEALLDVVAKGAPSVHAVWQRKGELLRERLETEGS